LIEPMFRTLPRFALSCGNAAWIRNSGARTLTAIAWSKPSTVAVWMVVRGTIAALFTKPSIRPKAAKAAATIRAGLAGSTRSSRCSAAARPSRATNFSPSTRTMP
jgi:hypothetical protein